MGRIIALSLGVNREDVLGQTGDYRELDNADFRDIDTIRDVRRGSQYVALNSARRCWLLDEVHGLPRLSQDALLKGLEDPPSHAYFVLCTTEPDKLLETIRSRCSRHRVAALAEGEMVRLLHRVASGEGERLTRKLLGMIYEKSEGRPREAINLLEKVLVANPEVRDAVVAEHEDVREKSDGLARALMSRTGWKRVAAILSEVKDDDVESVRRGVIGYCSKALLGGENDQAMRVLDQMIEPFFQSGRAGLVHAAYMIVKGE